jgi:short-subunit dehydrogenase
LCSNDSISFYSSGIGEGIAYAYAKDKVTLVLLARNLGNNKKRQN